jgi:precorrin-2 dehydrogenase/sirohydrochlorin ferrochelatase
VEAFPAYFPLAGRRVVIAGEGEGAEAKARLLESSPAEVMLVRGEVALRAATYAGACLAFVASPDLAFCKGAAAAARAAHTPVNVVDHPELSNFFTPAVIDRGQVVAAVGTAGAAPMLASLLRAEVETHVPEGAGRVAVLLRRHQEAVRAAFPDLAERRAFLRAALSGPAAQAAMSGNMEEAERLMDEAIAQGVSALGKVSVIAGANPDLVCLRAVRALGAADVVAVEAAAAPLAASHARRDAERLGPGAVTAASLTDLTGRGRHVALVVGAVDEVLVRALKSAAIPVEVFRPAPAP